MRKKLKYLIILCLIAIIAVVFICDNVIRNSSKKFVFSDIDKIPYNKVGLLLGTSKYLNSGQINQYFANRITATVNLYKAQKIDFIVISGDNSRKNYNEPLKKLRIKN